MQSDVEVREMLIQKVSVYNKNINSISLEEQKSRYAKALKKLREECFALISKYACEEVYINLYCEDDEEGKTVQEYGKARVKEHAKEILNYGMRGQMEKLDELLESLRKEYMEKWIPYSLHASKKLLMQ